MFHLVYYWCIRRTQYITSFGLFYKNVGFYLEGCLTVWKVVNWYFCKNKRQILFLIILLFCDFVTILLLMVYNT